MATSVMEELFTTPLRKLSDLTCSIVVNTRNIKKMLKKYPNLEDMPIECWIPNGPYVRFKFKGHRLTWINDCGKSITIDSVLNDEDSTIDWASLNKLLVWTYRTMCESMDNSFEFIDSPEDLLSFAETKLKQMLAEEAESN